MRKDPTEFRERFKRWKEGEQVYDKGLPKYEDGKASYRYYQDGQGDWFRAANDDMTRTFEGLVVTPRKVEYTYTPKKIDNSEQAAKRRDAYNATRSRFTGLPINQGLEIVSPEFDLIGLAPLAKAGAKMLGRLGNEVVKGIDDAARRMFPTYDIYKTVNETPIAESLLKQNLKPVVRTKVGDVEIDNPKLLYHLDRGDGAGAFSNRGAYVEDGFLFPGTPKDPSATPYSWWNKGKPFATGINGQPMTRLMTAAEDTPGMIHIKSQNYPIAQWDGKRGFVRNSEYVNPNAVNVSSSTYTLDPDYGWRRVFENTPTAKWPVGRTTPKITTKNAASMTPEQWTAAQDAAIAKGDIAEAQRLRDLHFKVNAPNTKIVDETGNPLTMYHGTTPEGDYILRHNGVTYKPNGLNMFFTSNYYGQYLGGANTKSVPLYINATKIGLPGNHYEIGSANPLKYLKNGQDALYEWGFLKNNDFASDEAFEKMQNFIFAKEVPWAKSKGLDLDLDNFEKLDIPKFFKILEKDINKRGIGYHPVEELAVPKGEQVKLAEAVTYDDKGIRIPLGKRDNFKLNDIRYGLLPFGIGLTGYRLYNK